MRGGADSGDVRAADCSARGLAIHNRLKILLFTCTVAANFIADVCLVAGDAEVTTIDKMLCRTFDGRMYDLL